MNDVQGGEYSQRLLSQRKSLVAWQRLRRFKLAVREIQKSRQNRPVERILDLGAADGIAIPFLAPLGGFVVGTNRSIAYALQFQRTHPDRSGLVADGTALPFADNAFDVAISLEALHLLPSPEARRRCFEEIHRVLHPDGVFVCSVPVEVGLPAVVKYFGRKYGKIRLDGMTFPQMMRHCFHHVFDVTKYDKGEQVGFNAYRFANDVGEVFQVNKSLSIPLPYPVRTNLMLACTPR